RFSSPYVFDEEHFSTAISELDKLPLKAIILDCMGYTEEMKQKAQAHTSKPVLLSRKVLPPVTQYRGGGAHRNGCDRRVRAVQLGRRWGPQRHDRPRRRRCRTGVGRPDGARRPRLLGPGDRVTRFSRVAAARPVRGEIRCSPEQRPPG